MRKRTARELRRIADRLDPKPARWYQVVGTNPNVTSTYTQGAWQQTAAIPTQHGHRRVLADYLTSMDLKKLRP